MRRLTPAALLGTAALLISCQMLAPAPNVRTPQQNALTTFNANAPVTDGGEDEWTHHGNDFATGSFTGTELRPDGSLGALANLPQGTFLSAPRQISFAFNAFMAGWQNTSAQGRLEVSARVSSDNRNWSNFLPLSPEKSVLLPQQARWIQYRVILSGRDSHLNGITFQFGYEKPRTSPIETFVPVAAPKPRMMTREQWQAAPPKGEFTPHTPNAIVLHHTWKPDQAAYKGANTIRGIQRYHQTDNKWTDIGYHYLIGPEGIIYQGRPDNVIGSHAVPNTNKIGISVVGDYDPGKDRFTPESYEALVSLMTWLTATYGISTNEFYGHRDFSPKTCPGDSIYSRMPEIKREVARRLSLAGRR